MKQPAIRPPENLQAAEESLEARLKRHPDLKAKIEALLAVVENATGDMDKANAAEQRMIEEIQQLGQAALQEWATRQNQQQTERFIQTHPQAQRTRKKTLLVQPIRSHRSNGTTV